jgi:hypothetical protein
MKPIEEIGISAGVIYMIHPDHRNKTAKKSQWTIPEKSEIRCFRLSHQSRWLVDRAGWGLHLVDGCAEYLGVDAQRTRKLFVARFEDGSGNQRWHGYPANPTEKSRDMVPERITDDWMTQGLLRPAVIRKLLRNQPCDL